MRTFTPLLVLLCAALPGCHVFTAAGDAAAHQPLYHYDPVALNELAAAKVRDGDIQTAWILLERAARLAPHDSRIVRNVEVMRAYRAGTLAPPTAEPSPPEPARSADRGGSAAWSELPELPPLWEAK